jgi:hypothetical protein
MLNARARVWVEGTPDLIRRTKRGISRQQRLTDIALLAIDAFPGSRSILNDLDQTVCP